MPMRWKHSPTTIQNKNVRVKISEDGKVTITKTDGELEDEVEITAAQVIEIANTLSATRKKAYVAPQAKFDTEKTN